ncbi:MAG: hypothetical protein KGL94_13720 [Acidobacteriota bacterium]|nr:hypothetical protein [Acidobacteriota bacterium]
MRRLPPLAALLLVLVLAACGGGPPKPYTAAASKTCFTQQGFTGVTTNADKVGFIAAFAPNGGLQARSKTGNVLTIAFADPGSVSSTERAFRRNAPARLRPHMADIMESQGNAVLVWTVSPTQQELSAAEGCLKS